MGNYVLNKADSTDTDVHIDPVVVSNTKSNSTRTVLDFDAPTTLGQEVETLVEDVKMNFTFSKDDVTQDLLSVESAEVDFSSNLTLSYDPSSSNASQLTLKAGFTLELLMEGQNEPNTLVFEVEDPDNYEIVDNNAGRQTIRFKKDQTIRRGEILRVPIRFTRLQKFPTAQGQGLYERGHFYLKTDIIARGKASIQSTQTEASQAILINDAEVPEVVLNDIKGIVDPNINVEVDPITVNGVPEFLKNNETQLDLTNPYIKLILTNGSPADVNMKADMITMKDGGETYGFSIGQDLNEPDNGQRITAYSQTTSTYYLSRTAIPDVVNPQAHAYNIVLGDHLYNMMRQIPDEIKLTNVEARALGKACDINLGRYGADYQIRTLYEMNAPLSFGDNLHIVYKDTLNDWSSDLKDISIKQAIVELKAENGIPLNFRLSADAIDKDGQIYPNVKVTPLQNEIAAGERTTGSDLQATESNLQLEITCENGVMKDLDGLIIRFEADVPKDEYQDVTLNENMTLRLTDIRLRVKNGIKVDLN
ncbi:MAG: hypothetical protein LUC45_02580 [Paraprevotella sp.]|nr:hypothetical protein [Paraprevotella sp.]